MTRDLLRLFIAIKLEDAAIVGKITRLQNDLSTAGLRAKLVEPENLHLTLKFIGEVPPERARRIQHALEEIKHSAFDIEFQGVGAFPSLERPRVLWIGVSEGASQLEELASQIENILARRVSLRKSDKPFHPHLTIARIKGRISPSVRKILESHANDYFGRITAKKFLLMRSTLTPRGPIYNVVEHYDLS